MPLFDITDLADWELNWEKELTRMMLPSLDGCYELVESEEMFGPVRVDLYA